MRNKIGVVFAASVIALAGLGISYAGFTDTLTAQGDVSVATVTHHIDTNFSGTWVWKVYEAPGEIVITHDAAYSVPPEDGFLVAWAVAGPGTEGYDVDCVWHNIFPCIPFTCDFWFTYTGTIPVKISDLSVVYDGGSAWVDDYLTYAITVNGRSGAIGLQIHPGDQVHCEFTIHLLQDDALQGLTASGHASLTLKQWNEV